MTLKDRIIKRMPTRWLGYVVYLIWVEQFRDKVLGMTFLFGASIGIIISIVMAPILMGMLLMVIGSVIAGYQDIVWITWGKGHFANGGAFNETIEIAFIVGLLTFLIPLPIMVLKSISYKKAVVAHLDKFEAAYPRRKRKGKASE